MPYRADPVLSLAVDNISKIDKVDCERLSSLWTVFTKCAENLENGRRLENLSWRLWYRECQLLEREKDSESATAVLDERRQKRQKVCPEVALPALSSSIDSAMSEDELNEEFENLQDATRPALPRNNSKGAHLTPDRFHELVTQFGQKRQDGDSWKERPHTQHSTQAIDPTNLIPNPVAVTTRSAEDVAKDFEHQSEEKRTCEAPVARSEQQQHNASQDTARLAGAPSAAQNTTDGNENCLRRASSVVHGFHPSCVSVKQPPQLDDVQEKKSGSTSPSSTQAKNMFFIDSSPSESDNEDAQPASKGKKKFIFKQAPASLKSSLSSDKPCVKKHTSFKEIVDEGSDYDSSPFDSDSDDEVETKKEGQYGDSAIMTDEEDEDEDGDDDDWDSICSESRPASPNTGHLFDKVDGAEARPGLVSRKSILSSLLTNPMTRLSNAHSKSSPAIAHSRRASRSDSPTTRRVDESRLPSGTATPLTSKLPSEPIKGSVSPRTTRRNMLATELSESLRRHLLWERKQKSSTNINAAADAVLRRRHTAVDLTKMDRPGTTSTSLESRQRVELTNDNEFGYNGAGW